MKNIILSLLMITGANLIGFTASAADCTTYAENENSCPVERASLEKSTAAFCIEPGKCALQSSALDRHDKTNKKDLLNSIAKVNDALGKANAKGSDTGGATSQEADK